MRASLRRRCDVAIVGAGAAGLASAIFLRRRSPSSGVLLVDSARTPGAKILVSGGSRCNVTNASVSEQDFWGGSRRIVRKVLRALPVRDTIAFFSDIGVSLHEEADGKLFPDSNRSRDVLAALLREADARGVTLMSGRRVRGVHKRNDRFVLVTDEDEIDTTVVVLATGGRSLPKTGSDGAGYDMAAALGHRIVRTTPGLVPLVLADDTSATRRRLTGVSHPAELRLWTGGRLTTRLEGSLLWTHFGISGPVALNMSRHWLRAELDGVSPRLTVRFVPGATFEGLDARWTALGAERPRASVRTVLGTFVPDAVAAVLLEWLDVAGSTEMTRLPRDERRRLVHALIDWPLPVTASRGYNCAEVTAGGLSLDEIDPTTMQSRVCPGLYLVGEILDVDGRIGGFNFQWAWSSAFVAARGIAAEYSPRSWPTEV